MGGSEEARDRTRLPHSAIALNPGDRGTVKSTGNLVGASARSTAGPKPQGLPRPATRPVRFARVPLRLVDAAEVSHRSEILLPSCSLQLAPEHCELIARTQASRRDRDDLLGVPPGRSFDAISDVYVHDATRAHWLSDVRLVGEHGVGYVRYGPFRRLPIIQTFPTFRAAAQHVSARLGDDLGGSWQYRRGLHLSLLNVAAQNNLYHWLVETLPRLVGLLAVSSEEPVKVIVPATQPLFYEWVLRRLVQYDRRIEIVTIGPDDRWIVEQLLVVDLALRGKTGFVHPHSARLLNNMLGGDSETARLRPRNRRIYISRSLAARRRVTNEEAMMSVLCAKGFEVVHAERLSYQEQFDLFRAASHVVGPHGAGIANILFAPPGEVMVLQGQRSQVDYLILALSRGLGYWHHEGKNENRLEDFRIDPERFGDALDAFVTSA